MRLKLSTEHTSFDTSPGAIDIKDIYSNHEETKYFSLKMDSEPAINLYGIFVDLLEKTVFTYKIEKPGSGFEEKSNDFPFPRKFHTTCF